MAAIQDVLLAWGRGRSVHSAPNGYPRQANFAGSMINPGDQAARAEITPLPELEHLRVDAVVSQLMDRKPEQHRIIRMAYIYKMSDSEICKAIRCSRSRVRSIRENAEHWIDGRLGY